MFVPRASWRLQEDLGGGGLDDNVYFTCLFPWVFWETALKGELHVDREWRPSFGLGTARVESNGDGDIH